MDKVLDAGFMALIQKMPLNLQLTLKNNQMGARRSSAKGSSVEFSDYRVYMPGDDFRRIDWNALARFEKVFIKLFMEEQEAPVTVFLDRSSSMDHYGKRSVAMKTAATFTYTALSSYDSVSQVIYSETVDSFRMGVRGSKGFWGLADMLERISFEGSSNLYGAVNSWQQRFRKGFTVIITDLLYGHELEKVLSLLRYRKQKVILCQVLSDEETAPVLEENHRFIDSETGDKVDIDAGAEALALYRETYDVFMNDIRRTCERYDVHYFLLNATEGIEPFLYALTRELK